MSPHILTFLRSEHGSAAACVIAGAGVGEEDFFRRYAVRTDGLHYAVAVVDKVSAGDAGFHVKGKVAAVVGIARVEYLFASDVYYSADSIAAWYGRSKGETLNGFHSLKVESYGVVYALNIDGRWTLRRRDCR